MHGASRWAIAAVVVDRICLTAHWCPARFLIHSLGSRSAISVRAQSGFHRWVAEAAVTNMRNERNPSGDALESPDAQWNNWRS
jgi:hypothetical protein